MEHQKQLRCTQCNSPEYESIVQGGSYVLRCVKCKGSIVATSWISVGPRWKGNVRVYRDGGASPVLEGRGSMIWEHIMSLAADGTTLVLRPSE
jgi:hypothetical protein